MPYDVDLADRLRALLVGRAGVTEKRMFGGVGFLLRGNLAVSASSRGGLLVRGDPADAGPLAEPGVEPMVMRGREMTGWLHVAAHAVTSDDDLERWVGRGLAHAETLPPK